MPKDRSTGRVIRLPNRRRGGADRVVEVDLDEIQPAPENDELYRAVDPDDPEIRELARSIEQQGLLEPIVVSLDGYVLSGHRRRVAARLAGLTRVPVRYEQVRRSDDVDAFVVLLREHNRQRDKSIDEKIREELVTADPHEAYVALLAHRQQRARVDVDTIELGERRRRKRISKAKMGMVRAVQRVLEEQADFLPTSDRRIHYALLNDPPFRNSKTRLRYGNNRESYNDLCDVLTRMRLNGDIPMEAISDDTRPHTSWDVHDGPRPFVRRELDLLLKGYFRNLLRSQPNHIELLVEKNTAEPIVRPVASRFCIPITSGRGYASLPPRAAMAQRFARSGKSRLVVLFVTDFDPDGEAIAETFARSMRDDFGVDAITPIKVALTHEQVQRFELIPNMEAKASSARYGGFVEKYGRDVYEIEALPPATLQAEVRRAIDQVIDVEAFNAELTAEETDAAWLDEVRQRVHLALRGVV